MAKDPAFLFYPNDWLGGTMGMTFEEKGAYMELLMMQFNRGHMTSHMEDVNENVNENINKDFGKSENLFDTKPTDAPEPSEQHYTLCAELIARTKFVNVKTEDLKALWPVFKIQYLTGQKYYADIGAVYSHFINWIKGQKFENAAGLSKNNQQLGTSAARMEAAKKW